MDLGSIYCIYTEVWMRGLGAGVELRWGQLQDGEGIADSGATWKLVSGRRITEDAENREPTDKSSQLIRQSVPAGQSKSVVQPWLSHLKNISNINHPF